MHRTDAVFSGSMPEIYERYLVPMVFEPYALDLAERVRDHDGGPVLELAAGTGVVTRAVVRVLAPDTQLIASDLNPGMLQHAATMLDAPNVQWQQIDATSIPFAGGMFSRVLCQFGVMFFPKKDAAYREVSRVLRRGGSYTFSVWQDLSANPLPEVVHETVAAAFPDDPPMFFARTPHGHGNVGAIEAALYEAEFRYVDVDVVDKRSRSPSPRDAAIGWVQGTPLRGEIERRDAARLPEMTDAVAAAIAARFGPGPVDAPMRAFVINAGV